MIRFRGRLDQGETLAEVLVAVIILGIAGVAVMAGLGLAVKTSDIHRKETTGGADVKNYAEALQNYVAGHQSAFTCSPDYSAATVGFTPAPGYTSSYTWSALGPTGSAAPCTANTAQLVRLKIASPGGLVTEQLSVVLRRPCSGDQTLAASKCS